MKTSAIKRHVLVLLSMVSVHVSFAQTNFNLSTLVGTYEGHPFDTENGEQDKASEVHIELTANFTLLLSVNKKGAELEIKERLTAKTAAFTQNGSLELHFEFADTSREYTDIYFSLLPASLGHEGVFISLRDRDDHYRAFQVNKQGGNPLIPGAVEGLAGSALESAQHQQFRALFADVAKGFTLIDGEKNEGYTVYSSDLYLTHTKPAGIYRGDCGVSYYGAKIKLKSGEDKWAYRDSLIQAIESYPNSGGLRVEPVEIRDTTKTYALTKFREPYGFIEFKEEGGEWFFRVFIPLDVSRLKEELMRGFELAENNFRGIRGKKEGDFFLLEEVIRYKSTRVFYGAESSRINRFDRRADWISTFDKYPFAVLAYQFREMDLTFSGVRKATEEKSEKQYFLRYEKPNVAFEITLERSTLDGKARLWISRKKNSNSPVYVAPIKTYAANREYPAFSGRYEGDDLYALMGRHWDDPAIKEWLNTSKNGFKKSRSSTSELCTYNAVGIGLTFVKSHLAQIELFKSEKPVFGTFKGKLPKGLRWDFTVSSIQSGPVSWSKQGDDYEKYEDDGVNTRLSFNPKDQDKLSEIRIKKQIIVDALEDIERGTVGVGLGYSINNAGKVSVNNAQPGYAARKAGIHEGMWILEIDGTPVQGKSKYGVNKLLEGKKGSTVKVKFCRRYEEENAKEYVLYRGAGGKAEVVKAVIPAISYPPFNGPYEGDALFKLLDRDFADPAIKAFINRISMKRVNMGSDPNRKIIQGKGIGLEFYSNTLMKISLNSYFFEGKLPQGLNFENSPAEIKTSNQLKWTDEGNPYMTADYNDKIELRIDFDENTDVAGTQSTFVYLTLRPQKTSENLVELGLTYGQGKESDIYEVYGLAETSSAYQAGVRMDDNIIKINGTPITGKPLADVQKLMRGKKGTSVKMVVERGGKELECTIVRE